MQRNIFIVLFFYCIYTVTGFGISTLLFFYSLKSPFLTNKHFPSSNANLFGKLILFCSLLMWFQSTADENVTATVLLHVLQLGW